MKELISFEEFTKVDIRVGTIIEISDFPKAHKPAYQLKINFGALGIKNSSAQITTLYSKKELIGKKITQILQYRLKKLKANHMVGFSNNTI